jgi:hypothetical protein
MMMMMMRDTEALKTPWDVREMGQEIYILNKFNTY